jgi:hypothetical protein
MIRLFAALCLLSSPALADDTAYCGESLAALRPGEGEAVAQVIILNRYSAAPNSCQEDVTLNGLSVVVQFANQPGREPDSVRVIVPSGFIAIPQEIELNEDEQGTIQIFAIEGAYS